LAHTVTVDAAPASRPARGGGRDRRLDRRPRCPPRLSVDPRRTRRAVHVAQPADPARPPRAPRRPARRRARPPAARLPPRARLLALVEPLAALLRRAARPRPARS